MCDTTLWRRNRGGSLPTPIEKADMQHMGAMLRYNNAPKTHFSCDLDYPSSIPTKLSTSLKMPARVRQKEQVATSLSHVSMCRAWAYVAACACQHAKAGGGHTVIYMPTRARSLTVRAMEGAFRRGSRLRLSNCHRCCASLVPLAMRPQ